MSDDELCVETLNEILENAGDEWDGDEAIDAIAIRYVRHVEGERDVALEQVARLTEALTLARAVVGQVTIGPKDLVGEEVRRILDDVLASVSIPNPPTERETP